MKEVKLKRYAGPFKTIPFDNYIKSPIGLVPKDSGTDTRLIFHLSCLRRSDSHQSVNACNLEHLTKVKYPDFQDAIMRCLEECQCKDSSSYCFIGKSDVQMGFRNLGIKKCHWKFLVLKDKSPLNGKWYYFFNKALPFGSSISCALFQKLSCAISYLVEWGTQKKLVGYLDDFMFIAFLKMMCNLHAFMNICKEIRKLFG